MPFGINTIRETTSNTIRVATFEISLVEMPPPDDMRLLIIIDRAIVTTRYMEMPIDINDLISGIVSSNII